MQNSKLSLYITGAILVALGLLGLRYPIEAITSLGTIIGIGLCISGFNYLTGFYLFRPVSFIIFGILDLIIGTLMIIQPGFNALVIVFVIAFWLAMTGFTRIGTALWLGGAKIKGWVIMLLSGIVIVLFSALMLASPFIATLSIAAVMAWALITTGILVILGGRIIQQ